MKEINLLMMEILMKEFDYSDEPKKLLTPEIVQMLSTLHEHKGRQDLFLEAHADELKILLDAAMIQSTGASNRIEGIFTSDRRLEEIDAMLAAPDAAKWVLSFLMLIGRLELYGILLMFVPAFWQNR